MMGCGLGVVNHSVPESPGPLFSLSPPLVCNDVCGTHLKFATDLQRN